jgi:hypothetical protein
VRTPPETWNDDAGAFMAFDGHEPSPPCVTKLSPRSVPMQHFSPLYDRLQGCLIDMPSEGIKLADSRHESHAGRLIEPFGSLHELSRIQKG